MKKLYIMVLCAAIAAASSVALAFEEQKIRPAGAVPTGGQSSAAGNSAPGLALTDPALALPRSDAGTKIRVPGLGVIGEIPKMDFGLELLYGASQPKQLDGDRSEANGVMGRVTVPLKSR